MKYFDIMKEIRHLGKKSQIRELNRMLSNKKNQLNKFSVWFNKLKKDNPGKKYELFESKMIDMNNDIHLLNTIIGEIGELK